MLPGPIPRHIAIIMDGNGRWANERRLPRPFGHRAGMKAVREVVEGKSFHLLEALAASTAETILERFPIRSVRVRIAKQNLGWTTGGRAVIEVTRVRGAVGGAKRSAKAARGARKGRSR